MLVAGGERNQPPWGSNGIKYSYLFDPSVLGDEDPSPWIKTVNAMSKGRWYPQVTRMNDGSVIVVSGNKYDSAAIEEIAEKYNPQTQTWTLFNLPGAAKVVPLYDVATLIPFGPWQGQVFYDLVAFEPIVGWNSAHRFNPLADDGSYWNAVGQNRPTRAHGNSVLLPIKSTDTSIRIVNLGGFVNSAAAKTSEMIEIGSTTNPQWISMNDLIFLRHDSPSALLLADGSLIVIGGGDAETTVLEAEMLDYSDPNPANWSWTTLDDSPIMEVPRKYHSTALLLPDARVWVGGSRIYTSPQVWEFENDMERRIEFYEPAYLDDGYRPEITVAPLTINYGAGNKFNVKIRVESDPAMIIDSIVLISLPSVTHCYDSNQRYIILDFSETSKGNFEVTPPANTYVAPPGYYMLFVLKDKTQSDSGLSRIPSKAKIVKLPLPI